MDDFLTAVTDAVLRGERNTSGIARRYGISDADAERIVPLIHGLKFAHKSERPSSQFRRKLYRDLMGAPEYTLVERVRYLPPSVQLAAGAAVSITAVLLLIGRFGRPVFRLLTGRAPVRSLTPISQ
ncbi:MAG: hypothetical protein JNL34_13200 [Anaerolineae bacterium]|nr:hypothetical protein [Anaerolineae bacterium]